MTGRGGVVTLGETMALVVPDQAGPLPTTRGLRLGVGGSESNVAIGLARLGVDVAWIGKVGRDSLGDLVVRELRAEGVAVHALRDDTAPTGLMVKERRTPADTRVWYYRAGSAGSRLRADELDVDLIRGAALLHVTGISPALSDDMAATVSHAIDIARDAGVLVSLDLNYRAKLWSREDAGQVYRALIPRADLVFGGDDEIEIALGSGGTPVELTNALVDLGAGEAVVKLGERGAFALADGVAHHEDAVPVDVVDTVGAGDAFVAGYLAEFLAGSALPVRMATAAQAGAHACLTAGDWESLITRDDLAAAVGDPVRR